MLKILLAEDSDIYRKSIEKILESENVTYSAFNDGNKALKAFVADPSYNLVMTDIVMPDVDGLELIRTIKDAVDENTIYFVAMSSGASSISADIALSSASLFANEVIEKPFKKEILIEILEKAKEHIGNKEGSS